MDTPHGCWLNGWRKSLTATTQECCEQYWICPGDSTPQRSSYTATYYPSRKLSNLDTRDTAGEVWDELMSDVLSTPSHGRAKARRPPRTYIQQLCADTGCSLEDLSKAIDDGEVWRERLRNICADNATWWWLVIWNHAAACKLFLLERNSW